MRSKQFQHAEMWERLGKPVERWRWGMFPQTVNAQYSSLNNEITFPAGILQPPFPDSALICGDGKGHMHRTSPVVRRNRAAGQMHRVQRMAAQE